MLCTPFFEMKFKNPAKVRPKGVSNACLKRYWEKGRC